jgi:hypothetical protein
MHTITLHNLKRTNKMHKLRTVIYLGTFSGAKAGTLAGLILLSWCFCAAKNLIFGDFFEAFPLLGELGETSSLSDILI